MPATVETLEGLERRITLTLNTGEIEAETGKRLQKLARNVKMDGFRPGKAPVKAVAARYGSEVRAEVLGDALQQRFNEEVRALDLDLAGYPRFAAAGTDSFSATFEVMPVVSIGDIGQIQVKRPVTDVSEADIVRTLDVLRKQRVQYRAVERASAEGDRVHIDYAGKIDGEAFQGGEARDFPVVLGEGRTLPEFEGSLMGMKAGEQKTFDVTFPADYFAKEIAGKTASFEATVKSVHEAVLPEVDDAFAQSLGVAEGGPDRLRAEIAENLRRESRRRIMARVKEQVLDGLLNVSPLDVPKGMVAMEAQGLLERAVGDLKARGMKQQDIKLNPGVFETQAKRRVALSLLLGQFAKDHGIVAADDQVRSKIEEFAQSYEDPSEVVAWYFQDAERMNEVQAMVVEDNIVDAIVARAQVTDEPVSLEQLMGNA